MLLTTHEHLRFYTIEKDCTGTLEYAFRRNSTSQNLSQHHSALDQYASTQRGCCWVFIWNVTVSGALTVSRCIPLRIFSCLRSVFLLYYHCEAFVYQCVSFTCKRPFQLKPVNYNCSFRAFHSFQNTSQLYTSLVFEWEIILLRSYFARL